MPNKIRVGVIFGGRSAEHEVSIVSATSVINALDRNKYEVLPIGITPEGRWLSSAQALDLLRERANIENLPELILVPDPRKQGPRSIRRCRRNSLAHSRPPNRPRTARFCGRFRILALGRLDDGRGGVGGAGFGHYLPSIRWDISR